MLILLAGCSQEQPSKTDRSPPPAVVVDAARLVDLATEQVYTGRIEAIDKVQIRARVQGYLKARLFDEGAEVKKGELLFEIEADPFTIAVQQAEANLTNAKAGLTLAEQTFERTQELASRGTSSKASLDTAQSGLAQAQANVKAREADLQTAKLNLGYTQITTPMDGRVGRSTYSVGNLVGPDSGSLVTVVAQDPMYVSFPVPQRVLLDVRKAGRGPDSVVVKLRMADGSLYDQDGKIEFVDVQATASTDSVTVRASIANPRRLLVDQQLVNVLVIRKKPEQKLVVSQSALLLDQQGAYVLALDAENVVAIRRITTGEQRRGMMVIDSGLNAGDRVIVSGHQKARPGAPVSPQAADAMTGAAQSKQAGK
ncbi:MAG: efflux RND transporter periplasmic adaptor subunit [Hyphomicrobiaceae bacterium]|nr:efflux RND transporter periplasmic adaptor subunit [Hyphomicrobiaceae bacterium]